MILGENNPLPLRMAWHEVDCKKKLALNAHQSLRYFQLYWIVSNLWPRSHTLVNFGSGVCACWWNISIEWFVCWTHLLLDFMFWRFGAKKKASGRSRAVLFIQDLSGGPLLCRTHNNSQQERAGTLPPLGQTDTSHQHHQGQGTTSLNRRGWNGKVALSVCAKGVGGRGNLLT